MLNRTAMLLCGLMAAVPLLAAVGCSPINWQSDPQAGVTQAAQTRQRAILQFVSGWDPEAARMDEEVFTDTDVQNLMREFVPIRVNTALNKPWAERFRVQKTPAFVVLRPDMSEAGRHEGTMTAEQFRFFLIRNRLK